MKKNLWMIVGLVISTSVLADDQLPKTAAAGATAATASAPATKKKGKSKKPEEKMVVLMAGPATVVGEGLNVRGQAKVNSEAIGRLHGGDTVTVIEQIDLEKTKAGEPRQWAKIALPASTKVWIHTSLVDTGSMTVKAKKANLRAGPGENFSVLGTIESGTAVKQVEVKGDWTEIEPPAGAYAFVAAAYLQQNPAPADMAAVPADASANAAPVDVPAADLGAAPVAAAATEQAPAEPVVVPRVVTHEGQVRTTKHMNAPTHYQLVNLQTDRTVDFLYTTNADLDLKEYNGRLVIVTGEEAMDKRWTSTPVLTIQKLQVVQ